MRMSSCLNLFRSSFDDFSLRDLKDELMCSIDVLL